MEGGFLGCVTEGITHPLNVLATAEGAVVHIFLSIVGFIGGCFFDNLADRTIADCTIDVIVGGRVKVPLSALLLHDSVNLVPLFVREGGEVIVAREHFFKFVFVNKHRALDLCLAVQMYTEFSGLPNLFSVATGWGWDYFCEK